jgi:tetratricopeptide (TPR) repeat protein
MYLQCLLETQQTEKLESTRAQVIKQITQQTRDNAGNVRLWNYLIELLIQTKSFDRAHQELALAERLVPIGLVKDIKDLKARVFFQQAMEIEVSDEMSFQKKLGLLSQGLVSGTIGTANLLAANMLQMCQQLDDSDARTLWLENALLENPNPVIAQVLLGYFAGITENYDECQVQWELASRKNSAAADFAGVFLFVAPKVAPDNVPQLRRMTQIAFEMFPNRYYMDFNLARLALLSKEFAVAEKTCLDILKKNPNSFDAQAILLRVYRETKDAQREQALLEKFTPEERKIVETLGLAL